MKAVAVAAVTFSVAFAAAEPTNNEHPADADVVVLGSDAATADDSAQTAARPSVQTPHAQPGSATPRASAAPSSPRGGVATYLIDGGAVPFFWLPTAIAVAGELVSPPASPLLFSASEGGAEGLADTIPGYHVALMAGAFTLIVGGFERDARWFHFKGMMQSLAMTSALAQIAKLTFGRHRPSYDPATSTDHDDRMSFFSGHSSVTAASSLYLGLYLRQHGFRPWRGDRALAWWEIPAYAGLAALATYIPYTRVDDNKHHLSDVLVGAAVGSTTAAGMFLYQESRFRRSRGREARALVISPWTEGAGASLAGSF